MVILRLKQLLAIACFLSLSSTDSFSQVATAVQYTLSFPEPQTHYVDVQMEVSGWKSNELKIKMPVWAPGSYLVREFSRHVEGVTARDADGRSLMVNKTSKNEWVVNSSGAKSVRLSYRVYAYELSVRTSFIDAEHAYLNGTSIFMYADALKKNRQVVKVVPAASWKKMSVALDPLMASDPWTVVAPDYDELVDAPFEIGNHTVFNFTAAGVPHEVAMVGEGNFNVERLKKDMAAIVEECTAIFREHPCKRYVFIVHNLANGGGGLEHLNSTTLQTGRWSYGTESSYQGFLSLVAHEYFHLWNVKRLRPVPLGPFNYDAENYTELLWIAEGFTAFYDDLIVQRCGFTGREEYLSTVAGNMSYCSNIKGGAVQSLSESSLDAWIKFYRPNENSNNTSVSYYTKGGVVAALLNADILQATKGTKSLDDVFREMYRTFYVKLNRPYTEAEFIATVKKVAGLDVTDFMQRFVHGTEPLPFRQFADVMGLELKDLNAGGKTAFSGLTTNYSAGKLVVTAVERNSPAWNAGVNVNDELIAMDDYRLSDDLSKFMSQRKPGDTVQLLISRSGLIKKIPLTLDVVKAVKYSLEEKETPEAVQVALLKKWLDSAR